MGKCSKKSCNSGCPTAYVPATPVISFKFGLYVLSYSVNTATVISTILAGATGGTVSLTPLVLTATPVGVYLVGGRFNVGLSNQIGLGVGGITAQILNGVAQIVVPGYGTTAPTVGAAVLASLITFGLATGTTFTTGTTVTLYFACT